MRKLVTSIFLLFLFIGCSNENDKIYELAKKTMLDHLKSPSSAKFYELEEGDLAIKDSAYTKTEFELVAPDDYAKYYNDTDALIGGDAKIDKAYRKMLKDTAQIDIAAIKITYEAQNSFGAMIKNSQLMTFTRARHSDGSIGDWKLEEMK